MRIPIAKCQSSPGRLRPLIFLERKRGHDQQDYARPGYQVGRIFTGAPSRCIQNGTGEIAAHPVRINGPASVLLMTGHFSAPRPSFLSDPQPEQPWWQEKKTPTALKIHAESSDSPGSLPEHLFPTSSTPSIPFSLWLSRNGGFCAVRKGYFPAFVV